MTFQQKIEKAIEILNGKTLATLNNYDSATIEWAKEIVEQALDPTRKRT
jgi:hypothetical protein